LNNLSQIYWLEGDLKRAIETCERALAMDADNLHAQGNLIRYLYFAGRKDEAAPLIERLKASSAPAFDRWKKIAETLAFIGDDQGMLELAARAEKEADRSELGAFFYHLVAVSECMLGNEKAARERWQRALKIDPSLDLASKNLDDLRKPVHERNGPWPFFIQQVIPLNVIQKIARFAEREAKRKKDENFQPAMQRFLDEHPEVLNMAPLLLKRGETFAKEFVFMMTEMSGHPALLSLLKEYAFGQRGSDKSRLRAARILSQLDYIPPGETTLWIQGEWRPILLLNFEITPEPVLQETYPLKPKALDLTKQVVEALRAENWTRAEDLSRRALSIHPEHPTLLTNLAAALEMQGKDEEREIIIEHVFQDFPNYFFGQMLLVKELILKGDLEQARSILDHWVKTKKKYHVTEFNILCKNQIDLFVQEENLNGALSWLDMWKATEPEDPEFETYQKRLAALEKKTNRSNKKFTPRLQTN
jgi:tetratricopeptide (TPR) repeat protein